MLQSFSRWTSRTRTLVVLPAVGVACLLGGGWLFAESGDLPKMTSVDVGSPPARVAGAGSPELRFQDARDCRAWFSRKSMTRWWHA